MGQHGCMGIWPFLLDMGIITSPWSHKWNPWDLCVSKRCASSVEIHVGSEILGRSQGHGCLGNPLKRLILGVPTHHSQSLHKSRDPGVQKVTCTRQVSCHSIFCLKRLVCRHVIIVKYNRNRFLSVLSLTFCFCLLLWVTAWTKEKGECS
jgi:hypothetical protein